MGSIPTLMDFNHDHRSQPMRWPTIESRMAQPMMWPAFLITVLFLVIGIGTILIAIHPPNPQLNPGPIGLILGGGFAVLGLTALAALFIASWSNRPFRHAATEVLAEVSCEPVLTPEQSTFSILPLQLERTASGFQLVRKPNLFKYYTVFAWLWMALIASVASVFLWLSPLQQNMPVNHKILISLGFLFCGSIAVWMITLIWRTAEQSVPSLIVDLDRRECRIESGKRSQKIHIDRILAVQLCVVYQRNAENRFPAVELNLVWKDNEPTSEDDAIRRTTLLSLSGSFYRLVSLAVVLADEFDVPLLNHATKAHWNLELERSRHRPAASGGYI